MLCVPAGSVVVVQVEVRVLPDPVRIAAEQPDIVVPLLVKFTVPPANPASQLTLALNVTLAPTVDGFCELPTLVYVGPANAFAPNSVRASAASVRAAIRRSASSGAVRSLANETR